MSAPGSSKLTVTGTTTFSQIKGCIISGILTVFMSGPGQASSFTVSPPAPTTC